MSKNDPHILGKERIGKLLLQYSIPAIIGMTITSIYNIIDSIFIGHGVGPMAIAGLAISFPLMNLVVAFCTLVSAGGSTLASIRLGQKDMKGATEILSHTLMLCITNSLFFFCENSFDIVKKSEGIFLHIMFQNRFFNQNTVVDNVCFV